MAERGKVLRLTALTAVFCGFAVLSGSVAAQGRDEKAAEHPAKSAEVSKSPKAVIELFTSQGCSSCPAADAMLGELANHDDLIAISLSVDHWDYLGWKDTLAQAKFSERHRAYAKALGDGMVYTPQMIVNGRVHVNGGDAVQIDKAVEKTAKAFAASRIPVRMTAADGRLKVEVGADPHNAVREATVWLAVISKAVEVPITRGENKGKTIVYSNVVRELMPIGTWHGKAMTVDLDRHTFMHHHAERCAVLLQQGRGGPIVGAELLAHF